MASYEEDRYASENVRQSDKRATPTQAGHAAAEIAHYTRLLAAECKWGVSNGALTALRSLGKSNGEIQVPQNVGGGSIT
jgi:hypothetical protein